MKKYSFLLGLGLVILLLTQCSLDDEEEYYQALGTLSKTEDSTIILSDDHERLLVENSEGLATLNNGDRLIAYFTLVNKTLPQGIDYIVSVYDYDKVLFKPVIDITSEIEDSIGNDPVSVNGMQVVNDILNVDFSYYGSGTVKHFINLVKQPGPVPTDTIELQFRHNNKDDYSNYVLNGLVSFDLESLRNDVADSVVLKIVAKGYQQNYVKHVTYKY